LARRRFALQKENAMTESRTWPSPAYRIETQRLVVRCFALDDAAAVQRATARERDYLLPTMPWAADEPQSVEQKLSLLRRFRGNFDLGIDFAYGIFDSTGMYIGGTGLHNRLGAGKLEIGYWLAEHEQGRGYATEVTRALVQVGFYVLGAHRLEIHCDPTNQRSARVAERAGFTLEGVRRHDDNEGAGRIRDTQVWSLVEGDPGAQRDSNLCQVFDGLGQPML
jgi:RimJ/RimL family protein N-acetyltransferase